MSEIKDEKVNDQLPEDTDAVWDEIIANIDLAKEKMSKLAVDIEQRAQEKTINGRNEDTDEYREISVRLQHFLKTLDRMSIELTIYQAKSLMCDVNARFDRIQKMLADLECLSGENMGKGEFSHRAEEMKQTLEANSREQE